MKLSFATFQFDPQQQLLLNNGNIVQLNDKALRLLALFLSKPKDVFSKAEILDSVWPDSVVSDQVVFQNISQLRALLGNNAIKTFSKKGYQWQLPIIRLTNNEVSQNQVSETSTIANHKPIKTKLKPELSYFRPSIFPVLITIIVTSILALSILFFTQLQSKSSLLAHSKRDQVVALTIKNTQWQLSNKPTNLSTHILFNSPFDTWKTTAVNQGNWLLATRVYPLDTGVALRFHIQGAKRGWSDYIESDNLNQAYQQLEVLLSQLAKTAYFSEQEDTVALTLLPIQDDTHANMTLVELQRAKLFFKLNELDAAEASVNLQLSQFNSALRAGLLHLLKTQINLWDQRWLEAQVNADKAIDYFQKLTLQQLESQALIELAWLNLVNQEFRQGIQILNRAASKARLASEPVLEVNARLTQSFFAAKSGQTELMHAQLDLAKELLQLHTLVGSHQVPIFIHLAWIANSNTNALPHYLKVLAQPFSADYEDDFYFAAAQVRNIYLEQQNYTQAMTAILTWQRPTFQILSHAHIALAQQQWQQSLDYSQHAFSQALTSNQKVDALDAALLILELNNKHHFHINIEKYAHFIKQKATRRWLSQNKYKLEAVNF
ncbi:hypothetical protein PSECIP111854_00244 [Pseudoalteromonas sp. CIP111854]|uniref:OmpR/PhoB-type domain-containing protein n=1 Tax=Pseudoalteromonas holothuriae TaxID=2963714 RepID=A0A9W4QR13_9GAMM|nr:winged helix-turn-helix domain-containing protein [Pseudoalteromonas sp. CIP111854]CAH9049599.1 hypothetical protein PSECIP111854_00244 [Pseudoalteromonas sp. CIP111854]